MEANVESRLKGRLSKALVGITISAIVISATLARGCFVLVLLQRRCPSFSERGCFATKLVCGTIVKNKLINNQGL